MFVKILLSMSHAKINYIGQMCVNTEGPWLMLTSFFNMLISDMSILSATLRVFCLYSPN